MHHSMRYSVSIPSWMERTREAMLMCHYCDTSSNVDGNCCSTEPLKTSSNVRQCPIQQEQPQQNEELSLSSLPVSSCWLWTSSNDNNFISSLLMIGKSLSSQKDDDDFIEIQYGVTPRNLQEDYELHRV